VVSPSQRKALEVRDRHCRYPGCTRPANWCEAHHVVHWIHDGPTNLDNLVLLCSRHHWQVHEGGWQLFMLESGEIEVLKPTLDFRAMPRAPAEAA
jgi:HNH endonuclease